MTDLFRSVPALNRIATLGAMGFLPSQDSRTGRSLGQNNPWGQSSVGGQGTPLVTPTTSATGNFADGPTEINVYAREPEELRAYQGANVLIQGYNVRDFNQRTGQPNLTEVARGKTDAQGVYAWTGQAPTPNTEYRYRVSISSLGRPTKLTEIPARSAEAASAGNRQLSRSAVSVVVCPLSVSSLVCEVAEKQVLSQAAYEQQLAANHYATAGQGQAKIASFAADMAHVAVSSFQSPELQRNADTYSWWMMDMGVLPKEWPDLVKYFEFGQSVWNGVPWPMPEGLDLFQRCARSIPMFDKLTLLNPRLYVKRYSAYFPRDARQMEADIAFNVLVNGAAIEDCIEHKILRKIKDVERSRKTWRVLGMATTFMLAPLAGQAFPAILATEVAEGAWAAGHNDPIMDPTTSALVTSGVSLVTLDPKVLEKILSAGLGALLGNNLGDVDPIVQQAAVGITSKLVGLALQDVSAGIFSGGATGSGSAAAQSGGALDFVSLQGLGSACAAFAVKFVANTVAAQGLKGVESLKNTFFGLSQLPTAMIPFYIWCIKTLLLDSLFDAVGAQIVAEGDAATPPGEAPPSSEGGSDLGSDLTATMIGNAEEAGVDIPTAAIANQNPVISSGTTGLGLAALTGVGVGSVIVGMVAAGVFGRS